MLLKERWSLPWAVDCVFFQLIKSVCYSKGCWLIKQTRSAPSYLISYRKLVITLLLTNYIWKQTNLLSLTWRSSANILVLTASVTLCSSLCKHAWASSRADFWTSSKSLPWKISRNSVNKESYWDNSFRVFVRSWLETLWAGWKITSIKPSQSCFCFFYFL